MNEPLVTTRYPLTGHPAHSAITVHAPSPEAIQRIATHLCQADRDELAALGHPGNQLKVIRDAVSKSREAYIASWDGESQAVFGISDLPQGSRFGVPWMLSTGTGPRHAREFMDISRKVIEAWSPMYIALANLVSEKHHGARRWLQALGFMSLTTHTVNGHTFHEMVRHHV